LEVKRTIGATLPDVRLWQNRELAGHPTDEPANVTTSGSSNADQEGVA